MYATSVLLRAATVLLCGVVGLEWLVPYASPQVQQLREHRLGNPVQPSAGRGDLPDHDASAILARPLFSIGRRPPAVRTGTALQTDDLPRLSGIMITGAQKHAIFEGDGKPKVTAIGDQVGDYRILAIMPSAVKVEGPHGTELVSLTFDANKRTVVTPVFSGPGLLNQFRLQRPPNLPVPQPPTMEQMMGRLPPRLVDGDRR